MNLTQLLTAARLELDDPDTGVDSRDLLWSDEELVRWCNQAQEEAAARAYLLFDDTTALSQIAIDTSGNRFPVDPKVIRVVDARIVGSTFPKLIPANENRLDEKDPLWGTRTGEPRHWVNRDKFILLDRIPLAVGVIQLECFRLPTDLVLGTAETLEIDAQHHESLLYWIKHRAYEKQDTETFDPAKSSINSNKFTARFGQRRTAAEQEVLRSEQPRRTRAAFF